MTPLVIDYGPMLEREIAAVAACIEAAPAVAVRFPSRWLAIELIENGADLRGQLATVEGGPAVLAAADAAVAGLVAEFGAAAPLALANRRYEWINGVVADAVRRPARQGASTSDVVDRVLTHRWAGVPIFLAAMWVVFKLTADVAAIYLEWIDAVVTGPLARWASALVGAIGLGGSWVESLLVDGIVAGVGAVLVFIPVLLTLYLALAVLEDSGYMARAALVMDRTMRALGLPGKSFLPMMVGFGCTVPAMYATRTLEHRKDRVLTGLLVPFMSCGARLPVYVLIAAVFFPGQRGTVVFAMYVLGVLVAIVLGLVMSRSVFAGQSAPPLVIELPPYRLPTLRSVWPHVRVRTAAFVRDAGTIILGTSLVVWLLLAIPFGGGTFGDVEVEDSAFGSMSAAVAPVLAPAGLGSWEATGALASGFVAKEVVISTLAQSYGVAEDEPADAAPSFGEDLVDIGTGFVAATRDSLLALPGIIGIDLLDQDEGAQDNGLTGAIRAGFEESSGGHGELAGLAFMVLILLYTPCMAAVAAERRELGSRWMWTSIVGQTALAWMVAVAVFQVGRAIGFG